MRTRDIAILRTVEWSDKGPLHNSSHHREPKVPRIVHIMADDTAARHHDTHGVDNDNKSPHDMLSGLLLEVS